LHPRVLRLQNAWKAVYWGWSKNGTSYNLYGVSYMKKYTNEPVINSDEKRNIKNEKKTIQRTFLLPLFSGIILVLGSFIIEDIKFPEEFSDKLLFLIDMSNNLLSNLGIAIIIASVFSFVSTTQAFIDFIKSKLISIIITKDYLNKLSRNEREEMVKNAMKFPDKPIYSGINEYFNKHIAQSLSLFEAHFRSAYQLNAIAKIDKNKNVVRVDAELRYRMYKVSGRFENFDIRFEDESVESQPIVVYPPGGEKKEIKTEISSRNELASREIEVNYKNDLSLVSEAIAKLDPEVERELERYDYLDTVYRFTEFGNDHWHLFTLRVTKPCDKLSIYLSCDSNLMIKKYIPFGNLNSFNANLRDEDRIIDIFCNEWIEAGLGVAILIAKREN
jgi:hypothetical protein